MKTYLLQRLKDKKYVIVLDQGKSLFKWTPIKQNATHFFSVEQKEECKRLADKYNFRIVSMNRNIIMGIFMLAIVVVITSSFLLLLHLMQVTPR